MISNEQLDRANMNIYNNLSVEKLENFLLELQQKSQYGSKVKYDITKDGYVGNGLYCLGGVAYTGKKGWDQFNKALLDEIRGPQFKIELNEKYYNDDILKMKNKNNKYYKPTVDEFHVGFEYEIAKINEDYIRASINEDTKMWSSKIFTADTNLSLISDKLIGINSIRVKILDKDDLVKLGFKLIENESYEYTNNGRFIFQYRCEKDTLILTYANWFSSDGSEYRTVRIEDNANYLNDQDEAGDITRVLFSGLIKNKSELSKLLKQLKA